MSKKYVLFRSVSPLLMIPMPNIYIQEIIGTLTTIKAITPNQIVFRNHEYRTDNENEINYLREHPLNGIEFKEIPSMEEPAEEPVLPKKTIFKAKTKNDVVVQLAQLIPDFNSEEVKSLSKAELISWAKDKYGIDIEEI